MRHLKEGPKDHLGEFVGLGVGHDEEDKGRNEGVLGLQQNVEHISTKDLHRIAAESTLLRLRPSAFRAAGYCK